MERATKAEKASGGADAKQAKENERKIQSLESKLTALQVTLLLLLLLLLVVVVDVVVVIGVGVGVGECECGFVTCVRLLAVAWRLTH